MGVDPDFLDLPHQQLADAALQRARDAGASHADVRVQRTRTAHTELRDARVSSSSDDVDSGLAVRVLVDGVWGFAASDALSPELAAELAGRAVAMARVSRPLVKERVELAPEPVHPDRRWVSSYRVDPFDVPSQERSGLLAEWSSALLAAPVVDHVDASVTVVKEQKSYADLAGTGTVQQRVLIDPGVTVVAVGPEGPETLRTLGPPAGRGWEYVLGQGWDWDAELAALPDQLTERLAAPTVDAGRHTLVIDPSNLWLTIHESVGHATELDRALGYEAAYAGTSFATPEVLGTLRYGSPLMNVTGDRLADHACATLGYDDEGVAAQSWDIVRDGVLVGFQTDRATAARAGTGRSTGCAYADSALHVPVQRMPNVSMRPDPAGPGVEDLIRGVESGLYVVGDKSWSIDMQRYNFQFTAQRFYRIRAGRIVGQVKDAAYQGSTPDFWAGLAAVGGPETYVLGGAPNCGKAQPGQVAWVSHGCPAVVVEDVRVLDMRAEGRS